MERRLITSESVSCGHPDKLADQLSDALLDAILEQDPQGKVACEVFVKTGMVLVGGEISTTANIDVETIVRETIKDIGYIYPELGFSFNACAVISAIGHQSPDIQCGVQRGEPRRQGAGDQGTMIGFASNETESLMPAAIFYAHRLMQRQAYLRTSGIVPWLRPDAKAQVSLLYERDRPVKITSCVLSTQHSEDVSHEELEQTVKEQLILPVLPKEWIDEETSFFINPTGRFVIGGPQSDSGLTGRKLMVDTYGTYARHGGGAFSGKDPSKVDRSAAYMARYIAKHLVAAGIAARCEVQLSYAIGVTQPVAVFVDTFGTSAIADWELSQWVSHYFDLTPYGIIEALSLLKTKYRPTAVYGHFGRLEFPWERLDHVEAIRKIFHSRLRGMNAG